MKKSKKHILSLLRDTIIVTGVVLSLLWSLIYYDYTNNASIEETYIEETYVSEDDFYETSIEETYISEDDFYKKCVSAIEWRRDYDEDLEKTVVEEMMLLPKNILRAWLKIDCKIVLCPPEEWYLSYYNDDGNPSSEFGVIIPNDLYNAYILDKDVSKEERTLITTAYNTITTVDDEVIYSHIYILGSKYYIKSSLLHEMGHFVYHYYYGMDGDYILPYFEDDKLNYIANDGNENDYYLDPDEYFAELFAYTINHGKTEKYKDTYVISKMIEDFK